MADLGGLSLRLFCQLLNKILLGGFQGKLELLYLLVKIPDLPEQFVSLWRNQVQLM